MARIDRREFLGLLGAGVGALVLEACGGGAEGQQGDNNVAETATEPPSPAATKGPEATATPRPEVVLTGGQLTSLAETSLMQIVPKTFAQLERQPTSSQKEQDVVNTYYAINQAASAIERYQKEGISATLTPGGLMNSLGGAAQRISSLYCSGPNPDLAKLFYSIKDYTEQEANKFISKGLITQSGWQSHQRGSFSPSCPIPAPSK